jgi:hypothetical protein
LFVGPDPIRPEIVYVPIRDHRITKTKLGCYIPEEGTANMATLLCVEHLGVALEEWTSRPAPQARGRPAEVVESA